MKKEVVNVWVTKRDEGFKMVIGWLFVIEFLVWDIIFDGCRRKDV